LAQWPSKKALQKDLASPPPRPCTVRSLAPTELRAPCRPKRPLQLGACASHHQLLWLKFLMALCTRQIAPSTLATGWCAPNVTPSPPCGVWVQTSCVWPPFHSLWKTFATHPTAVGPVAVGLGDSCRSEPGCQIGHRSSNRHALATRHRRVRPRTQTPREAQCCLRCAERHGAWRGAGTAPEPGSGDSGDERILMGL
jgi:hypothetical protein